MKDVFGKDIDVGDYVIYIFAASNRHFEKAIVVESEAAFIKIEYLGISSSKKTYGLKEKGKKGRLTATEKKVIIISAEKNDNTIIDVYRCEKRMFSAEIKRYKLKLNKYLEREKNLIKKNEKLQAEVDKIHQRFDILDL